MIILCWIKFNRLCRLVNCKIRKKLFGTFTVFITQPIPSIFYDNFEKMNSSVPFELTSLNKCNHHKCLWTKVITPKVNRT